ncbi:MAG: glycosyltransferase family 52 [Lachnospiraceae bacterium]|nr:glycosyltransferase family 52 [Lachnospiraceae bacterium]
MKDRVYVCHTFYHVYIAALKELGLQKSEGSESSKADLVLSSMSNSFGDLQKRAAESGLFADVFRMDEKDWTFFPKLRPLKENTGSLFRNMKNRVRFCRLLGDLEEPYMPVDFRQYKDIYVFCDSDPIGYYLASRHIRYHAVEDGLDCLRYRDTAREDNAGHFGLKAWLAGMGVIFIQNGYSRYCIDMEVNDLSVLDHPIAKMKEVPRQALVDALTPEDKKVLTRMFIANEAELKDTLGRAKETGKPLVLILTEPLCKDLKVRAKLFADMIGEYGNVNGVPGEVVIKPHPRDVLDYRKEFPGRLVLDAHFPMEILNFTGAVFDRVVTVYTVPSSIKCAREKIYLGNAFMDRYEDKSAHAHVTHAEAKTTHQE